MYYDLSHICIVFAFVGTLVLGWETKLICDPFIGSDINADHCSQAMLQIHDIILKDSSPDRAVRRRLFTRNNGDVLSMLPHNFVHASCAIGVDLDGMSGLAIASTWNSLNKEVETLVETCVRSPGAEFQRGFGGYYNIDGFTFVIANPVTVDTSGTALASTADRAPSNNDLSMTISIRAELFVMRMRDVVARLIPGEIQGGLAPISPDTYNEILVRQQGPWLLTGGTWVYRPQWFADREILQNSGWLLFRTLRPFSRCPPLYLPNSFHGSSIQLPGAQEEFPLAGIWLSEGVRWHPCRSRKFNILKALSFQWEWILIRAPGYHPETNAPPHS
ncbi:hypothetical protein MMC32_006912 [Xylographa parallela]|nr:hypothetical protein [Xylographa parallela]